MKKETGIPADGAALSRRSLCPHNEPFLIEKELFTAREVIDTLDPFLTPKRRRRIHDTVAQRTYSVVPVIEGLYDPGNVNAVLRSAEALGYQAIHIVEVAQKFKEANRVTQGAEKWLDIQLWESTGACLEHLKSLGYRIFATHIEAARPIADLSFEKRTALFFGNEKDGLTEELLEAADERVVVPMPGFTESVNISVAAALCLYHIQQDRCRRLGQHGDLNADEKLRLTAVYYLRSVGRSSEILLNTRRQG